MPTNKPKKNDGKVRTKSNKLDIAIFNYFHQSQTEDERKLVIKELKHSGIPVKRLDELLINHYYLAPQNLIYAQVFFAALCYLLTLAITVVRIGSDVVTILLSLIISTCLALPYILNFFLLRRFKDFARFKLLSLIGFYYSSAVGLIFVLVSLQLNLIGVLLIPLLLLSLYYIEVKKLDKLITQLALTSDSVQDKSNLR